MAWLSVLIWSCHLGGRQSPSKNARQLKVFRGSLWRQLICLLNKAKAQLHWEVTSLPFIFNVGFFHIWISNQSDSMKQPRRSKNSFSYLHISFFFYFLERLKWWEGRVQRSYFLKGSFDSHIILQRHCITMCVYVRVWVSERERLLHPSYFHRHLKNVWGGKCSW